MFRIVFLIVAAIFIVKVASAQSKKEVDTFIDHINADTSLTTKIIKDTLYGCNLTIKCKIKGFYKNDTLQKVIYSHGFSKTSTIHESFYILEGKIVYYELKDVSDNTEFYSLSDRRVLVLNNGDYQNRTKEEVLYLERTIKEDLNWCLKKLK